MNWKQSYTAATPDERFEAITEMLHLIEARQQRRVLVRGRLIRDRRRSQVAHFINDRRGTYQPFLGLYKFIFWVAMLMMSGTTWLALWHRPAQGAPLLAAHLGTLLFVFMIKPYRVKALLNIAQ
jgi:hypothetical protein